MPGISSGTALVGSLRVAEQVRKQRCPAVIVTIFPDAASHYLSRRLWQEDV